MQNDDNQPQLYRLSRRNVLAGLGTIGLASAGAGLGTSAFFSDEESFEDNTLVAGSFDLKVDWQQTYYGPNGLEYVNAYPDTTTYEYESLPFSRGQTINRIVYDDGEPVEVSSSPDNIQDYVPDFGVFLLDYIADNPSVDLGTTAGLRQATDAYKQAYFADMPQDFDGAFIQLDDVKPGDWGETTFSLHLFDNPGYLQMVTDNVTSAENGQTEPEVGDEGEDTDEFGELGDVTDVRVWYDDGDNIYEPNDEEPRDVIVVFDRSGSMVEADASVTGATGQTNYEPAKLESAKAGAISLVESLADCPNTNIGFVTFGNDGQVVSPLGTDPATIMSDIDAIDIGPQRPGPRNQGTNMQDGIAEARSEFTQNAQSGSTESIVLLGDGLASRESRSGTNDPVEAAELEANDAKGDGITMYTVQYDLAPSNPGNLADIQEARDLMRTIASPDPDTNTQLTFGSVQNNVVGVFQRIALYICGDVLLFEGSLSAFVDAASDGLLLDAAPMVDDETAERFEACSDYYLGFEWSVPLETDNRIQSDSFSFDITFEGEQARHNETPFTTPA